MAIHRDGIAKLAPARQMNDHYTQVDNFITHFGFGKQPLEWQTETYIAGRFTLTVVMPVNVDYSKKTVSQAGEPRFYLHAVEKIEILPGDRVGGTMAAELERKFGKAKWDEFVSSGFDLTKLGIPKSEIRPIAGFDEYVRAHRRPRVQIR